MTYQNELKFYSHKLHQEVLEYELKEEALKAPNAPSSKSKA